MNRHLCRLVILAVMAAAMAAVYAQTRSVPIDVGLISVDDVPTGACNMAQIRYVLDVDNDGTLDDQALYVCADSDADGTRDAWQRNDVPNCEAVPSGACTGGAACQLTGSLYLCNAGTWAVVSAGGDSVSIDGTAVTDPDFVSTGDIDFVDTSNTITANVQANSVALTTDTTGDYVGTLSTAGDLTWVSGSGEGSAPSATVTAAVLTGAEFAITMAQEFGSWTWDGDGDGTDERVACGDYDDDGTLELTDINSCRSLLPAPFTYSVSFDNDGDGTADPQYAESYYIVREIHLVPGIYTGATTWTWSADGLLFDGHGAILQSTFDPFDGANGCLSSLGGSSSNGHLFFSIQDDSDDFVNDVTFQNFTMQGIGSVEPLMIENASTSVSDPDGDSTNDGNCQKNFEITNPRNVVMRNVISRDSWRTNIFVNNNYSDDDTDGTVGHAHSMLFENVKIEGYNGHQGFEIQGGVTIVNSEVSGVENRTATSAAIGGTLSAGAGPVIIKNNKLHDVSQAISFSTEVNADADADGTIDGTAPPVEQIIIEGNEIWDYDEPAIQMTTAGGAATTYSPMYGAVIRGNIISDCGRYDRTTGRRSVLQFQENSADIRQGIIEQNQVIDCDLTSADFQDDGDGTVGDDVMVIDVEGDDITVAKNIVDITIDGTGDTATQDDGFISATGNNVLILDNIVRARNLDAAGPASFYAINLTTCDDCVVARNTCDFTDAACGAVCPCIALISNTNRLKIMDNHLNCNASDTVSNMLRGIGGTHDQMRFMRNDQTEGSQIANLTSVTVTEGVFGQNIATGLSSFFYSVDAANDFIDFGSMGFGNTTNMDGKDPDNERGVRLCADIGTGATEDGTLDAWVGLCLDEKTYLGFIQDGNNSLTARYFTGTCGASECFVFDFDGDGTIEAGDSCMIAAGPDNDCDGTLD